MNPISKRGSLEEYSANIQQMESDYCVIDFTPSYEPPMPEHISYVINLIVKSMADVRDTEDLENLRWQLRALVMDKVQSSLSDDGVLETAQMPLGNAVLLSQQRHETRLPQARAFFEVQIRRIVRLLCQILRSKDKNKFDDITDFEETERVWDAAPEPGDFEYESLTQLRKSPTEVVADEDSSMDLLDNEDWPEMEWTPSLLKITAEVRRTKAKPESIQPILRKKSCRIAKEVQFTPDVNLSEESCSSIDVSEAKNLEEIRRRLSDDKYPPRNESPETLEFDDGETENAKEDDNCLAVITEQEDFEPINAEIQSESHSKSTKGEMVDKKGKMEKTFAKPEEEEFEPSNDVKGVTEKKGTVEKNSAKMEEEEFEAVSSEPKKLIDKDVIRALHKKSRIIERRKRREKESLAKEFSVREYNERQNTRTCATETRTEEEDLGAIPLLSLIKGLKNKPNSKFRAEIVAVSKTFWYAEWKSPKDKSVMILPLQETTLPEPNTVNSCQLKEGNAQVVWSVGEEKEEKGRKI